MGQLNSKKSKNTELIRTTHYRVLNAEDHLGSDNAGEVWAANVESNEISLFWVNQHSKANKSIDYFISHTWEDDGKSKGMPSGIATWDDPKSLEEFGWRKSVAFQNVVRTITEMNDKHRDKNQLTFWLDKVCIPQYDEELKFKCISSLEDFISHSYGLIVLLTPRYPKRLWCVYEVACFLCTKNLDRVFVNFRSFCSDSNRNIYIDVIRHFSIDNCECKVQYDKTILEAKVNEYYKSKDHFGLFVQAAMSSLILRDLYSYPPMIKTEELFEEHVGPWMLLLREIAHLDGLYEAFSSFDVVEEYKKVGFDDDQYMGLLKKHLENRIYPYLDNMRHESCSKQGISLYEDVDVNQTPYGCFCL